MDIFTKLYVLSPILTLKDTKVEDKLVMLKVMWREIDRRDEKMRIFREIKRRMNEK